MGVWPPFLFAVWDPFPVTDISFKTAIENELTRVGRQDPFGTLHAGVKIDFASPELDRIVTLNGFGLPEDGGRWTIGPTAGLVTSLESAAARNAVLEMEVVPLVSPNGGRSLRVQCGFGAIREFTFSPGEMETVRIAIPLTHPSHPAALRIRFWVPDAVPAEALGFQGERRALGVRIYSLLLTTSWQQSKSALWPVTVGGGTWSDRWSAWWHHALRPKPQKRPSRASGAADSSKQHSVA
jgi:hypothetical protein